MCTFSIFHSYNVFNKLQKREREKERRNNGIKWEISREWVFLADGKFRTVNNNIYTIETRRLFPQHFSSLSRSFFFAFSCYRSFFSFALCHVWHVLSFTQLHQWRRIKDFSTVYETSEKRTKKNWQGVEATLKNAHFACIYILFYLAIIFHCSYFFFSFSRWSIFCLEHCCWIYICIHTIYQQWMQMRNNRHKKW